MMDTRLIYQVVEWDRRLEIENEKQKNLRPGTYVGFTSKNTGPEVKERRSFFARIFRHGTGHNITIHSAEPA